MEQSLRVLLSGSNLTEQTLLNVVNKLNASNGKGVGSDLYILTAEKLFDLPAPIQRHIVDKAEAMITIYNRLQEPPNQFQIRALICQSLICSYRAKSQRGTPATELVLKSVDFMLRALKMIQANSLYQPLALRAVFLFNQIAFPFFTRDQRHHLQTITPIAVQLLEGHLTKQFDSTFRLYISLSLLMGCLLDDIGKSDEASKQLQKLFTLIPADQVLLKYSLLHILAHFSRKSSGGLAKMKLDLNEQLQKAVIMYQTARSNNAQGTKDLAEVLKICTAFLDSKKEPSDETHEAEIIIGEVGRLAAQFNQTQIAEECQAKASAGRCPLARLHASLITAELALNKKMTAEERIEIVNSCNHVMSLAMYQGDLITVQDAAAMLWSHAVEVLHHPQAIKRYLLGAVDILSKVNSQISVLRSQMHFTLAKIFEQERDNVKALDQLKKALALDYLWPDHPTKLIHPFDRFIVPYFRTLNVQLDSYGQHQTSEDQALALIALPKKVNPESLASSFKLMQSISSSDVTAYDAVDATHYASVWMTIIKSASVTGAHDIAVEACHQFLAQEFDPVKYDTTVELQCEAAIFGIQSCFKLSEPNTQYAVEFTQSSITRAKQLKALRLSYNTITAIWNSFFSVRPAAECIDHLDFLNDVINHLFESEFANAKLLIGQFVNYYVQVMLSQSNEPPPTTPPKKKGPAVDPAKQKQLKAAEDLLVKALPMIKSISEKKALVDRMVEVFGKRNALPPNQSDQEAAILVTLATIMNEKVQHKAETLQATYNQIQNLPVSQPILFALLAEKASKLDIHQVTIDSAAKVCDMLPQPKDADNLYYSGLARFCRGLAFLRMIQPDLQEFTCQDKLRHDSATDFLRSAAHFQKAGSTDNARQSLSYFVSTVSVGENFPKFRSMLANVLVEAIEISKKVKIGDELRVRLFRIYLLVLIDQCDWVTCRKIIQSAIATLDKSVHCHLWELNVIVTANADCGKSEQPLIDEMLRVRQLGDSKYQSRLWSFVADLAKDPSVQKTALTRAMEVLKPTDIEEKFKTAMDYIRWLKHNNAPWSEIENVIKQARKAVEDQTPETQVECLFQVAQFKLVSTPDAKVFDSAIAEIKELAGKLWSLLADANATPEEDESGVKNNKASARKAGGHKQEAPQVDDFKTEPETLDEWVKFFQNVDKHKPVELKNPYKFTELLVSISDVMENIGEEYFLLKIWYNIILMAKQSVHWARYEQFLMMKFKLFLDRLNVVSPYTYSTDFSLTEAEKDEWQQKVGRYQADPPSNFPPLRKLLIREAELLVDLGEYKPALSLINYALSQAQELSDKESQARAICLLATVKARSGEMQNAIELLASASELCAMPMDFWVSWYSAGFMLQKSDFTTLMLSNFQMKCVNDTLSLWESIQVFKLYKLAVPYLSPEDANAFFDASIKGKWIYDVSFLPTFDVILAYYWRSLLAPVFPKSLSHFKDIGNEFLGYIQVISDKYNDAVDVNEDASLPLLYRLVDMINMFGSLVLRYAPIIRSIEANGLDMDVLGSRESLINEFIDKTQEPLPNLSPTAAILHFNTVQNIPNIPKKYQLRMNVYLGQCLHSIATDNVTLQNAVKYLWKGVALLTELEQFDLAGEIACELFEILRDSDNTGSIFQYLVAQSALAYRSRLKMLSEECEPSNRELLFVKESDRLRTRFMNPEISSMFISAQNFFEKIPNGTSLVRLGKTMEQVKQFVAANKNATIIVLDNLDGDEEGLNAAVITLGESDKLQNISLDLNVDEAAMKYEIFQQIIATTAESPPGPDAPNPRQVGTPTSKGKPRQKKGNPKSQVSTPQEGRQASFASEALKLNNPEFSKYIDDLNDAFEPMKSILPEKPSESVIILSSTRNVHRIPLECLSVFSGFVTIYKDFCVMSLLNRKVLCVGEPDFGNEN